MPQLAGMLSTREGSLDVTLPLLAAAGKVIGALGLTFKPHGNEPETASVEPARKMARELEKQIPSKVKLFEHARETTPQFPRASRS